MDHHFQTVIFNHQVIKEHTTFLLWSPGSTIHVNEIKYYLGFCFLRSPIDETERVVELQDVDATKG